MVEQVHACCVFQFLNQCRELVVAFQSKLKRRSGSEFGAQKADESCGVGGRATADGFTFEEGNVDALSCQVIGDGAAYHSRADDCDVNFFCHMK